MPLKINNYFVDHDPFDDITWIITKTEIKDPDGNIIFSGEVEAPNFWSENAIKITANHYLKIVDGVQEKSIKDPITRIVNTISRFACKDEIIDKDDRQKFINQLKYLLVNQYFAFNSPVWYNVGVVGYPQSSACFIQSVEDTMESILELQKSEVQLFRGGSGTGTNLSPLRRKGASLSRGGNSSGPVSFMRAFDSHAGVTKSGGKTRRAAKLVCLNVDHPDILEFIESKVIVEKMAHTLIDNGWDKDFNGLVYTFLPYQNANHSIRVTDQFMNDVLQDRDWNLIDKDGNVISTLKAKTIFRKNAEAAWLCGDPGLQYDNTINNWHTSPNGGRINASNPCSEYMFLDDSACNLASLNLKKFKGGSNCHGDDFLIDKFSNAVYIAIIAMESLVSNSSYPTQKIKENSLKYRPLGLGWCNGGGLLMSMGIPYDSDIGRELLATITSFMSAKAYQTSGLIAEAIGSCDGFKENSQTMIDVLLNHRHMHEIKSIYLSNISKLANDTWTDAIRLARQCGVRNMQISVIAPTGTIGFMMDVDTTGIEPETALVKIKNLVGKGQLRIVNQSVREALETLKYSKEEIDSIINHIEENGTIEGSILLTKDLPVFDCSLESNGRRSIAPMGHVNMMEAIQPFLSGAISKTVNLPETATVEDIENIYIEAWRKGLKSIAIYRNNCKRSQPLNVIGKIEVVLKCGFCDGITKQTGKCHTCTNCGQTTSCG